MKSFLKILFLPLLLLAACKKNNVQQQSLTISGLSSVAFASGDAISVYGSGFDTIPNNNTVLFDGTPGEVATSTPNRLQVIVPVLAGSGKLTVTTHGSTATSSQSFTLVNVLQGTYTSNLELTADKRYLLRGNVVFNAKLIADPGAVIYGEKATHGSLTVSDVDFQGTAAQPVVFTSDQAPGSRAPGDWAGITTIGSIDPNTNQTIPLGIMEYVRIEYAGYTAAPDIRGQALSIVADPSSVIRYIQVSYSASDGITTNDPSEVDPINYMEHLVAFGCAGDDLHMIGVNSYIQYALLLKDPYVADALQGNGVVAATNVNYGGGVNYLSNFTIVGYDPAARNVVSPFGLALNSNAGRGVKVGDILINGEFGPGSTTTDGLFMYNSVIAGGWQAAVDIYGWPSNYYAAANWLVYEDSTADISQGYYDISFRYNCIAGSAPVGLPYRGGVFGRQNYSANSNQDGYEDISGSTQLALFGIYNDTTRALDLTQGKDDLGIKGLTDYQMLNHPSVLPAAGSPLLQGAQFPASTPAATPFFNKSATYIGAFGTEDWTAGWTSFNPQQTQY